MERLFTLDAQFLFDAIVLALSMLVLFTLLSYLLFNPVRDMLKKRQERVMDDLANAKSEREAAIAYKEEYDQKLKEVVEYRELYPESSLQELSEIMSTELGYPITKSGLNHRFRKIKEMVSHLEDKKSYD